MNEMNDNATCTRADDLISVLYGEATDSEAADFRLHMQTCAPCQAEMRAFGDVRGSIGTWKLEALSAATAPEVYVPAQTPRAKSAITALREFFDLSPLWLKGATAFATLLFCLFAVLALGKFQSTPTTVVNNTPDAIYTEQQKDEIVKKALDDQKAQFLAQSVPASETVKTETINPTNLQRKTANRSKTSTLARGQRPLTRSEREQLAADLRLLQRDDDGIALLSEPINK